IILPREGSRVVVHDLDLPGDFTVRDGGGTLGGTRVEMFRVSVGGQVALAGERDTDYRIHLAGCHFNGFTLGDGGPFPHEVGDTDLRVETSRFDGDFRLHTDNGSASTFRLLHSFFNLVYIDGGSKDTVELGWSEVGVRVQSDGTLVADPGGT